MKNTKHTENLDNSTPQEITSQSKRKILTSIGVSSGIIGASALSQQWTKPIVNSIILPAHAHTTDAATHKAEGHEEMDGKYHDDNGMHFTTEPMPDDDDTSDDDTDDGDTDDGAGDGADPMIMVRRFPANGMVGDDAVATLYVSLNQMPTVDQQTGMPGTVTISISVEPMGSATAITDADDTAITMLTFNSMADSPMHYMKEQVVKVTAAAEVPDDADVMVKFMAEDGGYDDVEATAMFTIVEDDNLPIAEGKVKAEKVGLGGSIKVSWEKPKTTSEIDRYLVGIAGEKPVIKGPGALDHTW